jgi:hypothetical protein
MYAMIEIEAEGLSISEPLAVRAARFLQGLGDNWKA